MKKPVLLIVVNDAAFFISHRLPIAEAAQKAGYDVHVASQTGNAVSEITRRGFKYHFVSFSRSGKNPITELRTLLALWLLCWHIKPDVLHLVTIKPVLYGGIISRLAPVGGVLAAISGLGYVFTERGNKEKFLLKIISVFYKVALTKRNLRAVFQNPDDLNALAIIGAVKKEKATIIRGSGVDLKKHAAFPEESKSLIITFAARLLRDKGVFEYVEAARILKKRGVKAEFQLAGDPDYGNPTSISEKDLGEWIAEGVVSYLGYKDDIASVFKSSNIIVLPSYREGLPKVLMEAAACGRAVITTDVPGCRDAIEPGVTGLLVPVRSASALADTIQILIEDTERRQKMGCAGRALAERAFGIEGIVAQHLEIYRDLENNA